MTRIRSTLVVSAVLLTVVALVAVGASRALAHKEKHTPDQLKVFEDLFMEQVKVGDLLFHGDGATEKKLGAELSKTGMACAMCWRARCAIRSRRTRIRTSSRSSRRR